jgi:hypothetical protein
MRSLWIFLFLLTTLEGYAAGSNEVNCRFVCLDATAPPEFILSSAKGVETNLTVPTNSLSSISHCTTKGGVLRVLAANNRELAAVVAMPTKMSSVIIVLVASPRGVVGPAWQAHVIEDSPKNFQDGGVLIANFHNQDIRFTIGKTELELPPLDVRSSQRPSFLDDFNMAAVSTQLQQGSAWTTITETMLRFVPGYRYLIFATTDVDSGRPRILNFHDVKITTQTLEVHHAVPTNHMLCSTKGT